jgi:single-strand DNA-binding protein
MTRTDESDEVAPTLNEVRLRGRLADAPTVRELASGDVLAVFRVIVDRPPGGRVRVDTIECSTTKPRVRRSLARSQLGDQVDIQGSLRRRFWRTPTGPASRYAVEVDSVRIVKPGRRVGA